MYLALNHLKNGTEESETSSSMALAEREKRIELVQIIVLYLSFRGFQFIYGGYCIEVPRYALFLGVTDKIVLVL